MKRTLVKSTLCLSNGSQQIQTEKEIAMQICFFFGSSSRSNVVGKPLSQFAAFEDILNIFANCFITKNLPIRKTFSDSA